MTPFNFTVTPEFWKLPFLLSLPGGSRGLPASVPEFETCDLDAFKLSYLNAETLLDIIKLYV